MSAAPFSIAANGDDAPILATFATYAEAEAAALERSDGWLGIKMFGPSGKIAAYKDGTCVGYLDGTTRQWIDDR